MTEDRWQIMEAVLIGDVDVSYITLEEANEVKELMFDEISNKYLTHSNNSMH